MSASSQCINTEMLEVIITKCIGTYSQGLLKCERRELKSGLGNFTRLDRYWDMNKTIVERGEIDHFSFIKPLGILGQA